MAEEKNKKSIDQFSEEGVLDQLSKVEQFVQNNSKIVYGIAAVLVLAVGGFFYYKNNLADQELEAQKEIYTAQYLFSQDSIDIVLNGDGNILGTEEIADSYGSTDAGNLAKFYTGYIYLQKGEFDLAIDYLKDFSASDYLVQARAYSLIGDANMEMENYDEAIDYYEKASEEYPNEFFTPKYLTKLALAHEKSGDSESALEAYNKILSDFPKSAEANRAKKYSALLANAQ